MPTAQKILNDSNRSRRSTPRHDKLPHVTFGTRPVFEILSNQNFVSQVETAVEAKADSRLFEKGPDARRTWSVIVRVKRDREILPSYNTNTV
jgi:hypothetical protein